MKNTYKNGQLTLIVLKTEQKTYVAACEELCILVEHKDREHAVLEMLANAKKYLKNIISDRLGEHLLNQSLPEEFYNELANTMQTKKLKNLTQKIESLSDMLRRSKKTLQRDLYSF